MYSAGTIYSYQLSSLRFTSFFVQEDMNSLSRVFAAITRFLASTQTASIPRRSDFRLFVIVSRPDDLQLRHDEAFGKKRGKQWREATDSIPSLVLSLVKPCPSHGGDAGDHDRINSVPTPHPIPPSRSVVTLPDLPAAYVHHHRRRDAT